MTKVLNQQKVDELASEIGPENVPVLLDIFLGELKGYYEHLELNKDNDTSKYLADISHALKSSAASFGADSLCSFAISLDAKVKQALPVTEVDFQNMQELLLTTYQEYQQLMTDI
ncbi:MULTISPECIES: quorum-sensing phosphorelay protein LuxU [Vibrio]|jgi:two-component system phosphorelay protein LuxU|uniref:Phosphorelay protein LuxU n=3 Tax=Vibrio cyclitrophicus TaxID=47951 RepID=A0A7Z1ML89_9VIBR|nr:MULTISPECIES: quorum-sensing phosphorelay protein LuxU [Vibrio]KNH14208.1 phosphorelay protein LuxU [Vibrio lentus]MBY7662041.1 Hpt domain-containing protein [Vibrio atlanticus]ERM60333.1 Phosphorelay protein LuxU [Vibrio cyclitrophicus FF75]KAA8602039.1 Phosphorelay protein LuxU [Vibrio cyclitrophicus]MBE8556831.1 Hpt domain-containing protein [Vibrio sp. OPT24]|tara:strand:+ start:1331 stop:1675 length:345 start_codon:yes stop_codon:yes gene_type:complete